jgi:WD40 repeat protein
MQFKHADEITSICFSSDSSKVVTTSWDRTARIWDMKTGQLITSLGHETRVQTAHFCRNGQRLCTLSHERDDTIGRRNIATVWDIKNQKILFTKSVKSAELSPDGKLLLTWPAILTIDRLDPDDCETTICDLEPHSVTEDEALRWNVAPHSVTYRGSTLEHGDWIRSAKFSPDGSTVVSCSRYSTWIWSTETGQSLKSPIVHSQLVDSAQLNADGTRILVEYRDGTAKVWDAFNAQVIFDIPDSRLSIFSPDGSWVVTACENDVFQIYRSETGTLVGDTIQLGVGLFPLEFSLDGSILSTTSNDSLSLWNFKDFIAFK